MTSLEVNQQARDPSPEVWRPEGSGLTTWRERARPVMKRQKVNEVKKQNIPDPENIQFKLVPMKKKENEKSLK